MVIPRPGSRPSSPGLLHHLAALLSLAGQQPGPGSAPSADREAADRPSVARRRRRQQLALAQRLLDPLPPALRAPNGNGETFWRAVRWGGLGLLLARWLAR